MASEYSPELRIQLMQTGEKSGLWGDITNVNWELIESAVSGAATVTATAPDTILTASNGIEDEARCAIIVLTGSPAGAFNVFAPPETKTYIVKNNTSANASIYCSTVLGNNVPAGSAYTLLAGRSAYIRTNGVTFFDAIDYLDNPLSADSGGTGHASYAVGDLLYANTTSTLAKLADVATGNALISGGVNTAPTWGKVGLTTHVTGVLDEANGGTGQSTIPALSVLVANAINTLTPVTVTAGQSVKLNSGGTAWEAYTPSTSTGNVSFTGTAPVANQVVTYTNTAGTSITTGRTYQFRATADGQAQIQLFEGTTNGTESVTIQTPSALAASYTLTLPTTDGDANQFLQTDGSGVLSWAASGGAGTVTSVGLSLPTAIFDVTNSPVTTSGTLTASLDTQSANRVFAGPTSGSAATPAFRALVAADIPKTLSGTGWAVGGTANPGTTTWPLFTSNNTGNPGYVAFNNNSAGTGILCSIGALNPGNQILFQHSTSSTAGSGTLTQVGAISSTDTGTAYGTTSDRRLKTNIVPLTNAIPQLNLLLPKRYNWKVDPTGRPVEGFIADELKPVIPDAVVGNPDDVNPDGSIRPQQIDMSYIVPLLTAALQEAVTRIEALEAQLAAM